MGSGSEASLADSSSSVVFTSSRFSWRGFFAFDHLAFLENGPLGPAYGLARFHFFFFGVCGGGGGGGGGGVLSMFL